MRESENKIKELRSLEPLHRKMESKFNNEFELPELEKRQKALEEMRHQPYHSKTDIEDINNHSIEYQKVRKEKLDERIRKRMDQIKSYSNYAFSNKTKTFEQMSMREDMQNSIEEEKKQEKLRLLQNSKQYAKNVIDIHKPTISKRKQEEMKKIMEEMEKLPIQKVQKIKYERSENSILNNMFNSSQGREIKLYKNDEGKLTSNLSSISKIDDSLGSPKSGQKQDFKDSMGGASQRNIDGLDTVPENVAKYETALNPSKEYYSHNRSKTTIRGNIQRINETRFKNNIENQHKFVKIDYLAQERNRKIEEGGYEYKEQDFWKGHIDNPEKSALDKFHEIKFKAELLERKAKAKEEELDSINATNPFKKSEEVSSMYIDAIRAKAALLSNL